VLGIEYCSRKPFTEGKGRGSRNSLERKLKKKKSSRKYRSKLKMPTSSARGIRKKGKRGLGPPWGHTNHMVQINTKPGDVKASKGVPPTRSWKIGETKER